MKYHFDKVIDRRETDSAKWGFNDRMFGGRDAISMWVADMDFEVPQPVVEALKQRAAHGIFGYVFRSDSFLKAITGWVQRRHSWVIQPEWLISTPGVVPAVNFAISTYTQPGDKVIVQPPVYYPFYSGIRNNGRQIVYNPLRLDGKRYTMDLEDLEKKIDSRTRLIILCNPHNPVARVWERDELLAFGDLCLRRGITILSDEIHNDLIMPGHRHLPLANLSPELAGITVTFIAPSKTFNLAGLKSSLVIIPDPHLRDRYNTTLDNLHLNGYSVFGNIALETAYREGEEWLDQLLVYIQGNYDYMVKFLKEHIPAITVLPMEGTYLAWLDCRALGLDDAALHDLILNKARVALDDGTMFNPCGEGFQRINLACPRATLLQALEQITKAWKKLSEV